MGSGFQIRDWILANDPALSRFRMASRVTLTIIISFLILIAIHYLVLPLPTSAFGLGVVLSIQGGVSVRDKGTARQFVTRLLGGLASLMAVTIAAGLKDHRLLSDFVFLVIIFLAAAARIFGPRGFAIGMFAFISYFMGAYFEPNLSELPVIAIGPLVALVVGHVVRAWMLPDDWRRDLLRSLESVQGRVNEILYKLAAIAAEGRVSEADRNELRQAEERLKEVVLMAESFVPRPAGGVFDSDSGPAAEVALRLFDVHLAAESVIVLSRQQLPPFALVHAVIENDGASLERQEETGINAEAGSQDETRQALLWLGETRKGLADTIAKARETGFAEIESISETTSPEKIDFSLQNPLLRSALQITLASAIAMAFGLALSRERWFWSVLTAFLVFSNTTSRGDMAIRALQRSIGTLFGIVIGLGLATLLTSHLAISMLAAAMCIFLAFYFLQISYAMMTFFISIVLCLIYGMTGALTFNLLQLRLGETLIGSAAGILVAFLVFPARTRGAVDTALERWYGALGELLSAAAAGKAHLELMPLSQKLDAAYRDLTTSVRPLGSSWSMVTRPGRIRQTLALFLAATYWARITARNYDPAMAADGDIQRQLAADTARLADISPRGSECFFVERKTPRSAGHNLPLSRKGSRLGIEMIGSMLDRLYP
ncbi:MULTISPECIES: FUSC family protein [unclassified Sinorhizobium]|uniref:FUSC family protein n=1 Tax=unclassified Sinorhizobium TaxID=2613772 RepID=UPI0035249440